MGPGLSARLTWICLLLISGAASLPVQHGNRSTDKDTTDSLAGAVSPKDQPQSSDVPAEADEPAKPTADTKGASSVLSRETMTYDHNANKISSGPVPQADVPVASDKLRPQSADSGASPVWKAYKPPSYPPFAAGGLQEGPVDAKQQPESNLDDNDSVWSGVEPRSSLKGSWKQQEASLPGARVHPGWPRYDLASSGQKASPNSGIQQQFHQGVHESSGLSGKDTASSSKTSTSYQAKKNILKHPGWSSYDSKSSSHQTSNPAVHMHPEWSNHGSDSSTVGLKQPTHVHVHPGWSGYDSSSSGQQTSKPAVHVHPGWSGYDSSSSKSSTGGQQTSHQHAHVHPEWSSYGSSSQQTSNPAVHVHPGWSGYDSSSSKSSTGGQHDAHMHPEWSSYGSSSSSKSSGQQTSNPAAHVHPEWSSYGSESSTGGLVKPAHIHPGWSGYSSYSGQTSKPAVHEHPGWSGYGSSKSSAGGQHAHVHPEWSRYGSSSSQTSDPAAHMHPEWSSYGHSSSLDPSENSYSSSGSYHSGSVPNKNLHGWNRPEWAPMYSAGTDVFAFNPSPPSTPWLSGQSSSAPEYSPTSIVQSRSGYQHARDEFARMQYSQADVPSGFSRTVSYQSAPKN
ncbi:vitellogenin-1-like isoform X4 [Nerophis ophidion]|uniref:vitellogenin-1-like isoform X4 n=1 Tax=Nerophis ophidion TaxID=159077 RepID=UPI002ADF2BA1|nr:vitellogenin-1-like isoform X4 [Nerophis ophidion]